MIQANKEDKDLAPHWAYILVKERNSNKNKMENTVWWSEGLWKRRKQDRNVENGGSHYFQ